MLQKSSSKIVMVEKVFSVSIFCLFFFARESLGPWSRLPWGLILHGRSLRLSPTQGQPCKDKISTNTYRSSLFASPVLEDRANQPPSDLAHSIFPNHLDYESQSSFQPTNWLASAVPSRHNHRLNLNFQKKSHNTNSIAKINITEKVTFQGTQNKNLVSWEGSQWGKLTVIKRLTLIKFFRI